MTYTTTELEILPTLAQGQTDNLKVDDGETRVWLCRCGVADGMPYENQITEERLTDGRWVTVAEYPGGPSADDDEGEA
jgi:hypothetical protein